MFFEILRHVRFLKKKVVVGVEIKTEVVLAFLKTGFFSLLRKDSVLMVSELFFLFMSFTVLTLCILYVVW